MCRPHRPVGVVRLGGGGLDRVYAHRLRHRLRRRPAGRGVVHGIWHKLGSVAAVIVAGILDVVIGHLLGNVPGVELPFTYTVLLCPLVVVWYILTEAGSIIENAGALGAPIPAWLTKMIAALGSSVDQAGPIVK